MRSTSFCGCCWVVFLVLAALPACGDDDGAGPRDGSVPGRDGASPGRDGATPPGPDGAMPPGDDGSVPGLDGATPPPPPPPPPGDGGPTPPPPPPPATTCPAPVERVDTSSPDHVVGTGTPESCTESALATAIAAGGIITFDCGPGEATITLTSEKHIDHDTVIDGAGRVTLSGGGTTRLLNLDTGNFEATSPHLTVQRIRLVDGHASGVELEGGGGAIFYRGGSVTVIDSELRDNVAAELGPDVAGGAIYGIGLGETIVSGSTFAGNRASNGGAIGALGSGVTLVNSTLSGNTATGFGANYVEGGVQMGMGGNGGALSMDGRGRELVICGSVFSGNTSGAFGGAIFRTGYESERNDIDLSTFDGNVALDRTGAEADWPSGAGALYLQGVSVRLSRSTISNNRARSSAGVWILAHGDARALADLTNVTISGNATYERSDFTMRGVAAGLTIGDGTSGTILNCTITGNEAQFGSAIWNASPLVIRNTILANLADNEWTPLNCSGSMYAMPSASGDHNVQWPTGRSADDMDCTPGITRTDPMMGPLEDHGGPTPTTLPMAGGLPEGTDCPPVDQRGNPRDAASCTIGAVELP